MLSGLHHSRRRRLRGFGYLGRLGPGLITGAADDDPSGIGTYSQVGAAFGFGMLWTTVVSLPLAAAVQETAARLGLCSGKGLAALIKRDFPRGILIGAVALVCVANVFNVGADLGAMAASIRLLVPVPQVLLVVLIAACLIGLEIALPYNSYARVLRWLTLSLVAYIAVVASVHVPWGTVLHRTFVPALHSNRRFLAGMIAIFGTTISPYLFFWQASEEVEEEQARGENAQVATRHLRAMRLDVLAGMVAAVAIMFAIMVASAVTLGAHGITSIATADQAARALRPFAGNLSSTLFAAGIVATGALAVPVLAGSTAYALSEAVGWREGLSRKLQGATRFYGVLVAATAAGIALGLVGIKPIRALYYSAILNGIAAPPLILLMLLLSNSHRAVGRHTGGIVSNLLVAAALVLMTALPLAYLLS